MEKPSQRSKIWLNKSWLKLSVQLLQLTILKSDPKLKYYLEKQLM